jgi:hypothetical protein
VAITETTVEKTNLKRAILFSVTALAILFSLAAVVYASSPPITLNDGYEIVTNWQGVDVTPGSEVVATALTIDPAVSQVTFLWKNPAGMTTYVETVPIFTNGTLGSGKVNGVDYENVLVRYAISTQTPDIVGDWGIQALFQDSSEKIIQGVGNVVAVRARSFNVIPEVPILGAAGATIAMFAGLTYRMKRKYSKVS